MWDIGLKVSIKKHYIKTYILVFLDHCFKPGPKNESSTGVICIFGVRTIVSKTILCLQHSVQRQQRSTIMNEKFRGVGGVTSSLNFFRDLLASADSGHHPQLRFRLQDTCKLTVWFTVGHYTGPIGSE